MKSVISSAVICCAVFSLLFLSTAVLFAQTKPLTNDDILQMVKSGFDEQTIVKAIQANESTFDTSLQGLLALKTSGVSKPVMDAMLEAEAKRKAHTSELGLIHKKEFAASSPTADPPTVPGNERNQNAIDPTVYVEEVSSQGGVVASSDSALEAIKTLQEKHIRVVTIKDKADYVLQVTRQLGKKSWKKDTKIVLSNRNGEVLLAKSTRTVGGAIGDIAEYIHKHHE